MKLVIELTNHCNGNCVYCSNNKIKPKGYMELDMFKAVIDDFPNVKEVSPQWFGESSLHPHFYEALEYAVSRGKKVSFYTNGSLIDPERLSQINISQVCFSVEADNKELYEKIRKGLKWEDVYGNIVKFQELKRKSKTRTIVRMTVGKENRDRIKEIEKFWRKRVDKVSMYNEHPVCRDVNGEYLSVRGCKKPSQVMVVGWNGDYILCCTDYERGVVMGNVKDGARKIWQEGRKVREAIEKGKMIDNCKKCGFAHSAYLTKIKAL